jgi:hypothetical protein
MSLRRLYIFVRYSATHKLPLRVLARVMHVMIVRALFLDVNCSSSLPHASSAIFAIAIRIKIFLDTDVRRKLNTCWSADS